MTDKLKPCPFCGGEAKYQTKTKCLGHGEYFDFVFISCVDCGCSVKSKKPYDQDQKQTVTKNWNRRADNER